MPDQPETPPSASQPEGPPEIDVRASSADQSGGAAISAHVPMIARLSHEIPKPLDWGLFQRQCVILFGCEFGDRNTHEYGRGGQDQRGIDIIGRRGGRGDHWVGVQCRRTKEAPREKKMLEDCRAALALEAKLKEFIFVTTADNATKATDDAVKVERALRADGYDLIVAVYGWGQLCTLIARHPEAYAAFVPSAVAVSAPQPITLPKSQLGELATQIAAQVGEKLQTAAVRLPAETPSSRWAHEDQALHSRIDIFRDLFKNDRQHTVAQRELESLLSTAPLDENPWAQYRIHANLGSIALQLGRFDDAARHFEEAYGARPTESAGLANLALARSLQERYGEAMTLAERALSMQPRADEALAYLLQAAARSDWKGNPEDLIPADLKGSVHADFGLAEFLKKREIKGWPSRCLEIAKRHPDADEFKLIAAIAVLQSIVDSRAYVPGSVLPVTNEDLTSATNFMQGFANRCLQMGFADRHDLVAYTNNAAVLLRLQLRQREAEALLRLALERVPREPQLTRLLALSLLAQDRPQEALTVLSDAADDESRLLAAEILSSREPARALAEARRIKTEGLDRRLAHTRWRLIADVALRLGDRETFDSGIQGLHSLDADDPWAAELQIRWKAKHDGDLDAAKAGLRDLATRLGANAPLDARVFLADELLRADCPNEAISLLEGHVELNRYGPVGVLYLQCLAAARRDHQFKAKLQEAVPELRDAPEVLWTRASHAWNTGDLDGCLAAVEQLILVQPQNGRARLLKIESLIRQNRQPEIVAELRQPIDDLEFSDRSSRYRLAMLLSHFGEVERGARLAYRLFLEHRDEARAWKTLSILILQEGRGEDPAHRRWGAPAVEEHMAVDLTFEDGEQVFLIVEPDAILRSLDEKSWEPRHPLVKAILGLKAGDEFTDAEGRRGKIAQLRHKYVARLHYVLANYEKRFPENFFVRQVPVDTVTPGGLDEFVAELRARREWVEEEEERYARGSWPIGLLAERVGCDTIEAAAGIAAQKHRLKVAIGVEDERVAAFRAIVRNSERGCVLDLLAFWTAWELGAIDDVVAVCGRVHLPQGVLDRLHARRARLVEGIRDGAIRTATYVKGKIAISEVSKVAIEDAVKEVDAAITWIGAQATIAPVELSGKTPPELRNLMEVSDAFDALAIANERGLLLVTDDLATRQMAQSLPGASAAWLEEVFRRGYAKKKTDLPTQVRRTGGLIARGHNYVGVNGPQLAEAAKLDHAEGGAPGRWVEALLRMIGGREADIGSHLNVAVNCFRLIWSDSSTEPYRLRVSGRIIERLIFDRKDYREVLAALFAKLIGDDAARQYVYDWVRGHFIR